jgi:G3E family GTPase
VLSLQKTLTLVDARKLADPRYINHDTFNQQIKVADRVVGNKLDLYQNEDIARLEDYVNQQCQPEADLVFTQHGVIPLSALVGPTAHQPKESHHHHHEPHASPLDIDTPIPDCGYIKAMNKGEGYNSVGWRFSPDKIFSRQKLFLFLTGLAAERMKAVFITQEGVFGYNLTPDALTEIELDDCQESCIEIISETIDDTIEQQLLSCV